MSFTDDYLKLRKKRLEEEQNAQKKSSFEFVSGPYQNATLTADDIAPIYTSKSAETSETNKKSGWFKSSSAFDDGYQLFDVSKTVFASAADLTENLTAGAYGMGEKVVDAGAYIVGGIGGLLGADEFKNNAKDFIAKDLYDEKELAKKFNLFSPIATANIILGGDSDKDSVFAEQTDSLAQSGGQLAGTIALQAVGVPWQLTTGVTSFGGAVEGALREDATFEEAGVYGAIVAGAEILTEKLFGGSGLGEKGLINLEPLTKGISSKVVKTLADFGIDMAAEGSEEVIASVMERLASSLYKEESIEELLTSEEAIDEYINSFIGGAILGGTMNSVKTVKSVKAGRDYRTGLTENEQKVFDSVYNKRLAEAENNGQKLTKNEKAELYDAIFNEVQKGYISTDDIESVLGGETYKSYKETVDGEDAILKEFDELGKKQNATLAEQARYTELQEKVKEIKSNSNRNNLKSQLSEEVYNSVKEKDLYLAESYNERARRGTAFEADLSQYDEKTAKTVKNAIDSGILNNTRRTHEFVDMIAKISADKGVLFDFTNNEKLKESGFAVDGASVNGYVTKDGITVNISSAKATNSIVGHEITHVLEGTELYSELQTALFEYAKTKNDYNGRRKSLEALYKNVKDADIDAELTADLVGDYLFTDEDFINNLSTKHRNVFQKIYDEIKYLLKIATKGSKEARQLEKVKRAFDKAYRANGNTNEGTKYSLSDSDGKQLTKEQSEYFKDSKMRDDNGNLKVMYHGTGYAGFHEFNAKFSDDDRSFFFVDRNDVAATYSGTTETYAPRVFKNAEDANNFFKEMGFYGGKYGYEVVENDGEYTLLSGDDEIATSDNLAEIYEEFCDYEGVGYGDANYKVYLNLKNPLEVDAQGRNWNNISREFSQEVYDRYKSLTAEEKAALSNLAEWGEYSIFRDEMLEARATAEQGGSGVFDEAYTKNLARAYEKLGGANANLYDAFSIAQENFSEESLKEFAVKQMNTRDYARKAKAEGYDGVIFKNIVDNGSFSNGSEGASTVAIAFESNQIKSVANEKPTGNADIRYSLSDDGDTYSRIYDMQVEVNQLRRSIQEFENSDDFKSQMSKLSEAIANDDIENGVKAYAEWKKKSGYDELITKRDTLQAELEKLNKEYNDSITNKALEEEKAAIAKSGLSEADYFRKQAVKEFGYTPYFYDAGYITPNGKMLNFSGEKGYHYGGRGQDHRAIGTIYADTHGSDALNRFVKDGNIRIMAESPGIDISITAEPTKEQYATIRKFIYEYADKEFFNVDLTDENGRVIGSLTYENRINPARIINDIKHYYTTGEIREQSNVDRFRYSLSEDNNVDSTDYKINTSMTMAEAKRMIETAYKVNRIAEYYEGEYLNAEDWLKKAGADEVEMYIENDYDLQAKYINSNEDILNEEYSISDVLNAYLKGSLIGKAKPKPTRLDVSQSTRLKDDRFYSPQKIENAKALFELANQKAVGKDKNAITRARAEILLFAHNKGAAELLGVTQAELNKKLRSWSNYSATAKNISERINAGVAEENRWTGIENSSYINKARVTNEDIERLVASVEGESKGYQRQYIARVMLAVDTHIDYSKLKFKFATQQQVNADNNSGGRVLGFYRDDSRTIEVTHDKPNTVAHEMGHYLDAQWGRDLLGTDHSFLWLTNGVNEDIVRERHGEQGVQFLKNFKLFINSLSDVNTTYNAYYNDRKEIFARFFARFVEWTDNIATGNKHYSYESTMYGDQFTQAQFIEFARLLQEKALLDGNVQTANKFSLLDVNETPKRYGNYNIFGEDIRLEAPTQEEVAPIQEDVAPESEVVAKNAIPTEDVAPMPSEPTLYELEQKQAELEDTIRKAMENNDPNAPKLIDEYGELLDTIAKRKKEESAMESERLASLDDMEAPPEMEAPYYGESEETAPENPFEDRDIKAVGNRKVKAYMYENPEVKPFFQEEANILLGELREGTKGERFYTEVEGGVPGTYGSDSYGIWSGTKRHVSADIEYLLDTLHFSYDDIEKGLNAIIEDNGKENNAASKRIEFILNDRLLKGYTDFRNGFDIPPNQDYINLLNEKQIIEYSNEARAKFFEEADKYAPPMEDIAPVAENTTVNEPKIEKPIEDAPIAEAYEAIKPKKQTAEPKMKRVKEGEQSPGGKEPPKVAEILTEEPVTSKKKNRAFTQARTSLLDKGSVFEDLSLKTGNRELQAKYNFMHYSEARAQKYIAEHLKPIVDKVEQSGKTEQLYEYMYHLHNIDRMSLESNENNGKNKPVFGETVTADVSRNIVKDLEAKNPEFKEFSKEIIAYNAELRQMLVDKGVISQETADLWAKMYPHYVPIRRLGDEGLSVNVPLDTRKTGINAPIKRAKGGNRDIMPLFDTMAMRTEQTFKAIAKNSFGTELMHTIRPAVDSNTTSLDEMIESVEKHEELLQAGKNGKNPTFTVFENGKKVTFEISEDMYEALKPTSKGLSYTNKVANTASNIFRGLVTEYNPVFMVSNAAKDIQDVLINSQHAAKTYANIPRAIAELTTKGKWYAEYMANGGEQNTYFDSESKTFKEENKGFVKTIGMPIRAISTANNFIERVPRLAEYIASREAGASVEVAMLDAARVTTNFAAGGDVTKFINRNGATFLNASIQGFNQNVRNVREAKANGLKGWIKLSAKVALAGLPALLLNNLLWDDDEEYEELSEYVKDKYYIVAKTEDGKFIRIPKGRVAAVIQDAFEQINNAVTGNDEVDFKNFFNLVISNLAPNNPIENNILAPIIQVANNKTWYGEDLVPTRLQDLPAGEQYDESTDAFSKWLGEKTNISPYKLNYLLNQYSGGVGDVILPMLTPEAESGDNSFKGNILAPMKDKFTTDSTLNNKNVSAFYDTMDELTTNAKSSKATDEDILKYKYFNSINAELSELYAQKREIQNSDLADDEKYEAVRELQEQINDLARESLNTYENVYISDGYASIGDIHYRWYEPGEDSDAEAGWQKITDKQLEKQEAVTSYLGVEPSEYWKNKTEYDFAYEYPEKYSVAKSVGGYSAYKRYTSELYDIKADKDEDGKSISGSRKEKVIEYVNNLDIDYGARLILFKSEYNADDTYNYDIIDYLNNRQDISYEEMETILKELGFTVLSDGTIQWD